MAPSKDKSLFLIAAAAGLAGALTATAYFRRIRPWHLSWGATALEVLQPMPGDELVTSPLNQSRRAISIHASASAIWPWLVQIGYQRAGWYSYDILERLIGVANFIDGSSSRRILPSLQELNVGDPIFTDPGGGFTVASMEVNRSLVLRVRIGMNGFHYPIEGSLPNNVLDTSWSFLIMPLNEKLSRLAIRFRASYGSNYWVKSFDKVLLEPGIFLMEQKMLKGIKERVEETIKNTYPNQGSE
jgi:hypothetical protein